MNVIKQERRVLLETEKMSEDAIRGDKIPESNIGQEPFQQPSNKSSMPMIAGILLIIAGVLAFLTWMLFVTIDVSTIELVMESPQFQELDPGMTPEQLRVGLVICGTVGCIFAVFSMLGGVLALKRKLWGIALAGGILGLFGFIPVIIPGILALIGLILVAISRKEFQ